ncbi:MAG: hypothetical protein FWE76_07405 [Symbiobacteriaceae bacterium]|nr:hypothetical protein [Symbiobacteriaceae bacterium]
MEEYLSQAEELLEKSREERDRLLDESLADMVRHFLDLWQKRQDDETESATNFLAVITVLLEWKAFLLLPPTRTSISSDELPEDAARSRDPIDKETFRHLVLFLADRQEEQQRMLRREPLPTGALQSSAEDPLQKVHPDELYEAFLRIVERLLAEVEEEEMQLPGEAVSRQDCSLWLMETLSEHGYLHIEDLFRLCPRQRSYWVVVFILILEFIQQQRVILTLHENGEVWISKGVDAS